LSRWRTVRLWVATVTLTMVLTSMFWIGYYHRGSPGASSPAVALAATGATGGALIVPVRGVPASALSDTFSQARSAGERIHDAIDIPAPEGTEVLAAGGGTLEKHFVSKDGGNTLYIRSDDGGWIHYYAHLRDYAADMTEGRHIDRGTVIAHVGSTGNADPAAPHLHFAVHRMAPGEPWHLGTPVNPASTADRD
jgi:murein DD-endopeptidase MepM/ murein hydrolase activator NlpD